MFRTALLALAIAIGEASGVSAQTIKGSGSDSCGEWLQHRQAIAAQRATNLHVVVLRMEQSWIDGFVSGINATNTVGVDLLASHPGEGMYVWVDNYCSSKPLDSLLSASLALVRELHQQAEGK